jgi:hypothetical protein
MSRAVMRQALEALITMRDKYGEYACVVCDQADATIEALRAALMEPVVVQEPVNNEDALRLAIAQRDWAFKQLLAQEQQEPPRREWQGLTRDETMQSMNEAAGQHWADEAHIQRFARAIEAALKERNHG